MLLRSLFSRLAACCTRPLAWGTPVHARPQTPTPPAVGRRDARRPLQGLLVSLR